MPEKNFLSNIIRKVIGKSRLLIVLCEIKNNINSARKLAAGDISTDSGTAHSDLSLEESVGYIDMVFYENYLGYAGTPVEFIRGKKILEIGPGDSLGVAAMFAAHGAERIVCLDRFFSKRDAAQQKRIYAALRERFSGENRRLFDDAVRIGERVSFNDKRISYIHGTGIEEADRLFPGNYFDMIISVSVLEHLRDPAKAIEVMSGLLADGGLMIHGVDFRDHGMFSGFGMNPLTFLTINKKIYSWMVQNTDKPNRQRANFFREELEKRGCRTRVLAARLISSDELVLPLSETVNMQSPSAQDSIRILNRVRRRLEPRFRRTPEQDLITSTALILSEKK